MFIQDENIEKGKMDLIKYSRNDFTKVFFSIPVIFLSSLMQQITPETISPQSLFDLPYITRPQWSAPDDKPSHFTRVPHLSPSPQFTTHSLLLVATPQPI